jgi:hypothetical protein
MVKLLHDAGPASRLARIFWYSARKLSTITFVSTPERQKLTMKIMTATAAHTSRLSEKSHPRKEKEMARIAQPARLAE